MNTPLLVLIVALTIFGLTTARSIEMDQDNSIEPKQRQEKSGGGFLAGKEFVKISNAPPKHITQPIGTTIELECEAIGSPPPTIQWLRGDKHSLSNIEDIVENNMIVEQTARTLLARVRSRLIIDHVSSADRQYTCVGRSAHNIAHATTVVSSEPGSEPHNITELLNLSTNLMNGPKKARIVNYSAVILASVGTDLLLPCKAVGRPRPKIHWLDINDNIINGQDPRFKVLNNGDLLISDLRWPDMGAYSCVARNPIAKDTTTSFVYPVYEEDDDLNN